MPTFLLERFWPGITPTRAMTVVARDDALAATMRGEGRSIRVVRTTLLPGDETLMSIVEAESEQDVAELGERAEAPADRVVAALELSATDEGSRPR